MKTLLKDDENSIANLNESNNASQGWTPLLAACNVSHHDTDNEKCDDVKDKHVLSFSMFPKFKDEDFTLETNITKIDISDLDVNLDNYKSSDKNKNTKIEKPKTILEKNSQYLQKKTYKGLPLESDPNYISARDRMFERLEKNNKKTVY